MANYVVLPVRRISISDIDIIKEKGYTPVLLPPVTVRIPKTSHGGEKKFILAELVDETNTYSLYKIEDIRILYVKKKGSDYMDFLTDGNTVIISKIDLDVGYATPEMSNNPVVGVVIDRSLIKYIPAKEIGLDFLYTYQPKWKPETIDSLYNDSESILKNIKELNVITVLKKHLKENGFTDEEIKKVLKMIKNV